MATEMQKGVIFIDQDAESSYQNGDVKKNFDDDGRVKRTGIWVTTSAHIITAVIGSGVLSLAWAIAQLGWAAGPAVLLAFSFITYFTSSLLADCYRSPDPVIGKRNYTYMDVVRANLGTWTASAHIITAVIGFGVLSLAWATAQLGLAADPAVLLAFSFLTYFTSSLLVHCYGSPDPVTGKRNYTYKDVVRANFSPVAVVVKPLPVFVLSLLCMAISLPAAHSARLLQSPPDNLYGGSDDSIGVETEKPEYDARYLNCWRLAHTPVPTSPTPINDDKKGKEKHEDDAIYLQCSPLAPAPAPTPTSLAPTNDIDDKKEKEKLEDDAMHLQCQSFAPTPASASPAPISEKLKDDAMYFKCWSLAPTPAPSSAAHINDNKKNNPKLLFFCGYPCCGFNIHGPCDRCCPVLLPSPPTTHV